MNPDLFASNHPSTIRGGKVTQNSINDMSGALIDSMNHQ